MITEIYREIVHCVADEICDKFVEHVHETAGKDKEVSSEWVAKELKNFFGTYDYTELVLEQMECVAWSPACPEIISDMELYYALDIYVESRGEIK
ncbi:hypothetical protein EOM86_12075, partial [Candidatus Nomurabacteria bacterium]|nr:hypothetical protein [Candidatus Nomurabacteria bacterium]